MSVKVSVIIPCYNQGIFLAETVESVLNQTLPSFEIIIVDDGSTDSYTKSLLASSYWPKTSIFRTENRGVSNARNFGIEAAKGEYILPLDGDDKIGPRYLERACAVLDNQKNVRVVTCEVEYFGQMKGRFLLPSFSLEGLMGQNLLVCTSLFRKSDYLSTPGYNENMKEGFEDWDFWLSLLKNGGEVVKLDEVMFYYRIRNKSRNRSISEEMQLKLRKQIYNNHVDLYSTHFFNPLLSFEYTNIKNSKEYKVGKLILFPLRRILKAVK